MRIIVVEQDAALGQFLARSLRTEGHEAEWVGDGESALTHADTFELDLMVLDLILPELSGAEVLDRMHRCHDRCSVIALTPDTSAEARVRCLNSGADDALAKPFSLQELLARCRAQLRRRERLNGALVEYQGLVLNRRERTVRRAGIGIELTGKEFALLEYLIERRGRCSSRAELLRHVFQLPETSPTNVVEVYINYLRRKLSLAGAPPLIETVRGSGYRVTPLSSGMRSLPAPMQRLEAIS